MQSSTRALHRWIQTHAFGFAKHIDKLGKFLRRLNVSRSWAILAACQGVVVLLLLLTWPKLVTISLLLPQSEAAVWESLIEEFEHQNPDIQIAPIKRELTTDEMEAIYNADSGLATPSYDLLYLDMIWVQQFAAHEKLKDLTELVPELELSEFLPEDIKVGQYQGKLYWLPLRSDVGVLFYRDDLLAAAGYADPPQTFQDLLEISRQIQSQGLADWGYLWQGQQYEGLVAVFEEVLAGYGGFWIDQETNAVGLDQPAALEAVKFLQQTIQQGISPAEVKSYNEGTSFRQFAQGKTVFLRNWPFIQLRLEQLESLRNRVKIAPMVHAKGRTSTPCKGGWGFSIARNAAHPQEAWRAIEFFTSEAAQRKLVLESGYLPSRSSLFQDSTLLAKFPYLSDLYNAVENSVPRPLIPQYKEASDILQRYLTNALNMSLSDAALEADLKAVAEETRNLLKNTNARI